MNSYQWIFDQALALSSEGIDKKKVLNYIASEAEKLMESGCAVSILLLDEKGLLRNGASPSLPVDYLKAIDGIKPDPNVGTCAAAAATGQVVITNSFLADDKWKELKHLPMALGYVGAWSVPIKTNENCVLGTIGVYLRNTKVPKDADKQGLELLTKAVAHILNFQEVES